jgi:hypothetical protein
MKGAVRREILAAILGFLMAGAIAYAVPQGTQNPYPRLLNGPVTVNGSLSANPLIANTWQASSAAGGLRVKTFGGGATILSLSTSGGAGILTVGTAGAGTSTIQSGSGEKLQIQSGGLTPASIGFFANGTIQFNSGTNNVTKLPYTFSFSNQNAVLAGSTQDFAQYVTPSTVSGFTPIACSFSTSVTGTVGGSCTYMWRDVTTATTLCTVTQSCTTAINTTATCAASGTITGGDIVDFRITAPAGDTSAIGSMICTASI